MMAFGLSNCPDAVGEFQRAGEVFEGVRFFQSFSVNQLPISAQLLPHFFQRLAGDGRGFLGAGDAVLAYKLTAGSHGELTSSCSCGARRVEASPPTHAGPNTRP